MRLLLLFFALCLIIRPADACINPDAQVGTIIYNSTHDTFQGCTYYGWQAFHGNRPSCPTGNIIAHWRFDETSGTTAYDSVGTYNAAMSNMDNSNWVSGKFGNALNLDGVNEYLTVTGILSNFAASDWTFSIWIYQDAVEYLENWGDQRVIFSSRPTNQEPYIYLALRYDEYWFRYIVTTNNAIANTPQTANEWINLVGVISGDNLIIYKNGVVANAETLASPRVNLANTNMIIGFGNALKYFDGKIDDFRVFKSALSPADVALLYGNGGGCIDSY